MTDRLTPGQRVRLIHWLDGRLVHGPLGMVEADEGELEDAAEALFGADIGMVAPAYVGKGPERDAQALAGDVFVYRTGTCGLRESRARLPAT